MWGTSEWQRRGVNSGGGGLTSAHLEGLGGEGELFGGLVELGAPRRRRRLRLVGGCLGLGRGVTSLGSNGGVLRHLIKKTNFVDKNELKCTLG